MGKNDYFHMVDTGEIETVGSNDVERQAVTSIGYDVVSSSYNFRMVDSEDCARK